MGDFNGDGVQDLVTPESANNVTVVLGDGSGSFEVAPKLEAGTEPWSVAAGDFNNDGIPDLLVANKGSNNASVLLGNGDGTFQVARNFAAGDLPRSVAVGDFNGDGLQDFVVANNVRSPHNVSVLLGNGDGSFKVAQNFSAGDFPRSVAVGDFNGDGLQDLAVAYDGASPAYAGGVSVLLGTGDGNFQPALSFALARTTLSIAVGDFNGDGRLDLAVAYAGVSTGSSGVAVLLANGDGSFQAAQHFGTGDGPSGVAIGDFNGDGIQDLAVSYAGIYPDYNGAVAVLLGTGDGSFQGAQHFMASSRPMSVAVGDFNSDGMHDLAVANEGSNDVSVLLGKGDGNFQPARTFGTGMSPKSVAVGDFNGDGIQDLAVANALTIGYSYTPFHDWGVSVLINNTLR